MSLRIIITIFISVFFTGISPLHAQVLSGKAEISLLTGSSGEELYSTFGHSAVRVKDPKINLDLVYNYGTFDFSTPNFYIKFLRGKLDYMLSLQKFSSFKRGFIYENRSITELILDLDSTQKQETFDFLKNNHLPENRYYHYEFFFDNCATRIRDLFQTVLGEQLQYNYPREWTTQPMSFRQLLDVCLTRQEWSDFGMDIIIGVPTDRIAKPREYMYLPMFLEESTKLAKLTDKNGKEKPFVKSAGEIVPSKPVSSNQQRILPHHVTWGFFIVILLLTVLSYHIRQPFIAVDVVVFTFAGLFGWFIVFLWFFTDHQATKDNINIFWAIPLHVPLIYFIVRKRIRKIWHYWLAICIILITAILFFWSMLPQQMHPALIPVLGALELRLLVLLMTRYVNPPQAERTSPN